MEFPVTSLQSSAVFKAVKALVYVFRPQYTISWYRSQSPFTVAHVHAVHKHSTDRFTDYFGCRNVGGVARFVYRKGRSDWKMLNVFWS